MKRPGRDPSKPSFEELSSYLDGELPPDRLEAIDRWLVDHPEVIRELQKIRRAEKALRGRVKPLPRASGAQKAHPQKPGDKD